MSINTNHSTDTVVPSGGTLTIDGAVAASNISGTNTGDQTIAGLSPLTTKGDVLGFSTANARVPVGADGHVLTADSTAALGIKWAASAGGSAALTATQIGFGSSANVLTGSSTLTWDNTNRIVQMGAGTGLCTIRTAAASSGANAASLTIQTGAANSGVVGAGALTLQGGAGAGASAAGDLLLRGGDNTSGGAGRGGHVTLTSGTSTGGAEGDVIIGTALTGTELTVGVAGVAGTRFIPTSTTAPANGMYLQAANVVGLAANSTAAYKYGSNAFLSQTNNSRDLGENAVAWRNIYSANAVTVTSDERAKTDIKDTPLGLEFILALRPVSYRMRVGRVEVSADGKNTETPVPGVRRHHGLLAQQVRKAMDAVGVDDFAGWVSADPTDPGAAQALRYGEFVAPLVRAVQELAAQVRELKMAARSGGHGDQR